jgi:hypothetical protein
MRVERFSVDIDLSLAAFTHAVGKAGAMPDKVILLCPDYMSCVAYKIREEFHCAVRLVPADILANKYAWAVLVDDLDLAVWSCPSC